MFNGFKDCSRFNFMRNNSVRIFIKICSYRSKNKQILCGSIRYIVFVDIRFCTFIEHYIHLIYCWYWIYWLLADKRYNYYNYIYKIWGCLNDKVQKVVFDSCTYAMGLILCIYIVIYWVHLTLHIKFL